MVASTSAIDCLERLVSEMTCYVSSGTLNPTHSVTHSVVSVSVSVRANVPAYRNEVSVGQDFRELCRGHMRNTVKPFNLAAVKVGDFACKIILAAFILAN